MNNTSRALLTAGHGFSSSNVYSGFINDNAEFSAVSDIGSHMYGNIIKTITPITAPCSIFFIVSFDANWACLSISNSPKSKNMKINN